MEREEAGLPAPPRPAPPGSALGRGPVCPGPRHALKEEGIEVAIDWPQEHFVFPEERTRATLASAEHLRKAGPACLEIDEVTIGASLSTARHRPKGRRRRPLEPLSRKINLFHPDSQASAAPRAATVNGIRLLTANLEPALRLPPSRLDAAPRAAAAVEKAFCPDSQAILPYAAAKDTTSTQSRYLLAKDTPATLRPPLSEGTPPSTPEHLSSRT
uniref:Uncharacterized protein n=1 Tax=Oryza glumipatula TaxID=40148 RepID=A0A0E0BBK4_9ORYZ